MPGISARRAAAAERPGPAVRAFAVIGVDVLADQRDFAHAIVGEPRTSSMIFATGRENSAPRV